MEVIFTISLPLNLLGFSRTHFSTEEIPLLWSRDTEKLFAHENLEQVLEGVPDSLREILTPYIGPFCREWPSFYQELTAFREHLRSIWMPSSKKVFHLMDELGFIHSGLIEVFPVMRFFREWPRSNPLTMPACPFSDREILEFLIHEMLHRTTDEDDPHSLWHYLSMTFLMKKVPREKRFLLQHALIYVASSWIVSQVLKDEFVLPEMVQRDPQMECYMNSIFELFSTDVERENPAKLAEKIAARCSL